VVHEIDGAGKGDEDNAHHQSETDKITERVRQRRSEDCDGSVITRSVEEYPLTVSLRGLRWFCDNAGCGGAAAER